MISPSIHPLSMLEWFGVENTRVSRYRVESKDRSETTLRDSLGLTSLLRIYIPLPGVYKFAAYVL